MSEQSNIDTETPFYVADWYVDPTTCRITKDGQQHKIEPKAMTVLVCLAQKQGHVISRELLEEKAWPDMVVGYDSLASAIIKLRKAFGDNAKNPEVIETVPKKGYRLICPVSTTAASQSPGDENSHSTTGRSDSHSIPAASNMSKAFVIIIATVFAIAALFPLYVQFTSETAEPNKNLIPAGRLVIAVLPFKNLSDDKQQDYFSDGITVDLITDLSKVSGLSVIARNSVFIFKNTDIDIRTVQRELGVDYVVEGSIRKIENQVRISARLIDARTSINIWAERFDGTLDNIFTFQDAVTSKIINALSISLTEQDKSRLAGKYSDSIEAYDQFLHGWQKMWLSTREGMVNARENFNNAIKLDDQFARAYANLALTYVYDHLHGWSNNDELALQKAHEYADKAIAIDPNLPQVYWVKGFADIFERDYQQSLKYAQMSIDLSPNFADGYGLLATTLNYAGNPKQADDVMRKAMQLNPRHPAIYKVIYGEILFNKGDYTGAIENFTEALNMNPDIEESRIWLAAAYANIGDTEEASWQLEQVKVSGRELSLKRLEKVIPFKDPEQRKAFIDGLYKAGIEN
ncbi:MAG: winged helix-turn-helix domain-containing protein [Gammaproteobacteria bacterium]|nr:winged helix-turn-helix domain-containing protein [Gammaproteobacteria bacterium]